ncbi:MAG: PAS domain S-box protein [Deltaproteobacteria bacterium]|nr:PAS domain S-box protein [Deltaproteobacteria bacterium]
MTDDTPLYNSRILKSYVEYLKRYLPDIDIAPLLNYADIETYQLDDEGHWLTQRQVDRFHTMLAKTTQDADISRKVGRFSVTSRASGALGQYMLGFINPATAYSVLEKINARLSRAAVLKTKAIGADKIEVKAVLQPGVVEKPYQCHNRLGGFEALARLSTNEFAIIEHPVCIHKGGDCCLYLITWEKTRVFFWKRIRNYSFILGFILCLISLGMLNPMYWDTLVLLYIVTAMGVTLYTEHLEKKDLLANIQNQGDAADRLLDQINKRYNEALLIQEIGQAASMILDVDKLLVSIMESLEKRLDFDRGMIMLADKQKNCLVYTVSYGYNPKDEDYLKNIKFHLDNPLSKGVAVEAFRKQKPFLVNDVSDIENDLSPKSLDFVRAMGSQSFICVPIVYKGESLGVLMVDNVQSKKPLSQTEMSLLMGIAPQIGISINNALAYHKIKESEEYFREIIQNASDIIFTVDERGIITYVSPSVERIVGYSPSEVIGTSTFDLFIPEDLPRAFSDFKKALLTKDVAIPNSFRIRHKDGTELIMEGFGKNLLHNPAIASFVTTVRDVTERKRNDEERQGLEVRLRRAERMEALGTLAGGVAHDLNNVLGVLVGYSELMLSKIPAEDPLRKYVANIMKSSERGAAIIQDLLTLARRGVTVSEVVNINNMIAEYLKTPDFEKLASLHPHIDFRLDLDPRLLNIKGSPVHLGKTLMNLVTNAAEAITDGGIVMIRTENRYLDKPIHGYEVAKEGDYVVLTVSDNGQGIPATNMGKIFEPFYTRKVMGQSGTGLGLAVVWGAVKDHNGFIDVQSEEGKGTQFILFFPVTREDVRKEQPAVPLAAYAGTGEAILVVDDVQEQRELAASILTDLGYNVQTVASGEEAVAFLESHSVKLLVLDMIMEPGMDGLATYRRVLEINPQQRAIVVSGFSETERVRQTQELGAGAYVRKPYIMEQIGLAIRKELDRP